MKDSRAKLNYVVAMLAKLLVFMPLLILPVHV